MARLAPGWRKVWVEFVEYDKRTPLVFTFFPEGHGPYRLEFFELKPAIVALDYSLEGEAEARQERAFEQALEKVMAHLEPLGYVVQIQEVSMEEIREYLGYDIDENEDDE